MIKLKISVLNIERARTINYIKEFELDVLNTICAARTGFKH